MSVVNGKTADGNPSTVCSLTIGTRRTSSTTTSGSSDLTSRSTSSADPTMRNMISAVASGEITFGAMPPSIDPSV